MEFFSENTKNNYVYCLNETMFFFVKLEINMKIALKCRRFQTKNENNYEL